MIEWQETAEIFAWQNNCLRTEQEQGKMDVTRRFLKPPTESIRKGPRRYDFLYYPLHILLFFHFLFLFLFYTFITFTCLISCLVALPISLPVSHLSVSFVAVR